MVKFFKQGRMYAMSATTGFICLPLSGPHHVADVLDTPSDESISKSPMESGPYPAAGMTQERVCDVSRDGCCT